MGIINVSPESFYKPSISFGEDNLSQRAITMVKEGAEIIDLGGMSTAPYIQTEIPVEEEIRRLTSAIKVIRKVVDVPISVDTPRSSTASTALEAGATIVNDVSGLKYDSNMANVISKNHASAILMAHETIPHSGTPIERILASLQETLRLSDQAGIHRQKIIIDPGLGFFRREGKGYGFSLSKDLPWYAWDASVIRNLEQLRTLGRPFCISISRKSFIGKILDLENPNDRLNGSLAATAIAVLNGVNLVRTHDVAATVQAVRIAESIRKQS